jgi:diguanylate cyclase (GGDEF)-like protein/PAS domain S-box-containing protein
MNDISHQKTDVILLVDDEPQNIQALNHAVADLGTVYFANNGNDAISIAKRVIPDVILLDIQMPDIDGYEVCRQLKNDPLLKETAIIFITAHNSIQHELKALEYGGIGFLHKPVNPIVAKAHVNTHLALKNERHQLKLARSTLHNIIHHLPSFVAYWDENLNNVFSNDDKGRWFGYLPSEMLGKPFEFLYRSTEALDRTSSELLVFAASQAMSGQTMNFDLTFFSDKQETMFASASFVPTLVEGTFSGLVMLLNDVTPLKIMQKELYNEKELLKVTLNSIGDAVIATDVSGQVTFMNPIAESLTGWLMDEAINQPIERIMPLMDSSLRYALKNPVYLALEEQRVVGMALNSKLINRNDKALEVEDSAAPIMDQNQTVKGAIIVFHDVSEARAMALKMSHLANHDPLTNLPNRMLLQDRGERTLQNARRKNEKVAMLVLDIDNFKKINDLVGHSIGDILLQQVAKRILECSRELDTISRQGGDEFIILQSEVTKFDQIVRYTERVMAVFSAPFWVDHQRFNLSCSIGVSLYPNDALDMESLYRHADSAMYQAKQLGRSRWHFFSRDIESSLLSQHNLEQYLHYALENDLFEVFYQAKMDPSNDVVVGVEALVRLRGQDKQMLSPGEFIPLAEESGLIIPIGKVVLEKACKAAADWQKMGFYHNVSINISAIQFSDEHFFDMIKNTLAESKALPHLIELEITEGVLAKNVVRTKADLELLKVLGVQISVDDFGTGYSSLSYLKRFPIDILKIDQSFVRDMLIDPSDAAIVDAIISLAKSLDMKIVAEGAETIEQVRALAAKGCQVIQGFYYCKPIPYDEMCDYLNAHSVQH